MRVRDFHGNHAMWAGFKSRLLMSAKILPTILAYAIAFHLLVAASIISSHGRLCSLDPAHAVMLVSPLGFGFEVLRRLYMALRRRGLGMFSAITVVAIVSIFTSAPVLFIVHAYEVSYQLTSMETALLYLKGSLGLLIVLAPMAFLEVFGGLGESRMWRILDNITTSRSPPLDVYVKGGDANVKAAAKRSLRFARIFKNTAVAHYLLVLSGIIMVALLYYWLCTIIG
jgi:hypothetical protein